MAGLTAREMQYEAKVMYEALASADAPGYTDRQWSILLTQAQEKLIREIISEGWDKNETNRRIASALMKTSTIDDFLEFDDIDDSWKVQFPTDYFHLVKDTLDNVKISPKSWDFVEANKDNPFEKPYSKEFWRLVHEKGAVIVTDGSSPGKYRLTYIRRPKPIITKDITTAIETYTKQMNCELDPVVHRKIVERAAKLAESYIGNQLGYQLKTIEEQSTK